jgi:membrane dipeptidase
MTQVSERVLNILKDAVVVDATGANAPIQPVYHRPMGFNSWIDRFRTGGVNWVSLTVGSDHTPSLETMIKQVGACRRYLLERPDEFVFVETVDDVARAKTEGKMAVNFNLQGSNPLMGDVNLVEVYRRLGVGHMLLSYNDKNMAGGGCHDQDDPGLSPLGRRLVEEMNRVGMVVDATHTAYRTTMEIFEVSKDPVIFSHSNPRALYDHERNIRDDQIQACARSGGVVGINGVGIFLSGRDDDASPAMVARHIDYVAQLVGPQHVGLGLDYVIEDKVQMLEFFKLINEIYGDDQYPILDSYSFTSPAQVPQITDELLTLGYGDEDVINFLGDNWMRVFRQVWQ